MTTPVIEPVPGARPIVEIGIGDNRIATGQARWSISRWDDAAALWAGLEPTWFDVSCEVHELAISAGRSRTLDKYEVGTATVILNNQSGWADLDLTPPDPALLTVRPGRQLRIGVALDGDDPIWLFRGVIDEAEPSYDPSLRDIVTLACIDAKGEVGRTDIGPVEPAVGAGEFVSDRIHRILTAASWRAELRDIAPSSVRLIGTDLGTMASDALDAAADSAVGAVYGDTSGRVAFRPLDWMLWDEDAPPDGSIGNVSGGDVCPSEWALSFRRIDIATRVRVGRQGEDPIVRYNPDALLAFGIWPLEREDMQCQSDSQLEVIAQRLLRSRSPDYMPRVEAVLINAATARAARDLCATVDVTKPSRYRCRLNQGRTVFDRQMFATGVEHTMSRYSWTCRISLDDAAPFVASPGTRWDSGHWDIDAWGQAIAARAVLDEIEALRAELVTA